MDGRRLRLWRVLARQGVGRVLRRLWRGLLALCLMIAGVATGCAGGDGAWLSDLTLAPQVISPNADGSDDVTLISYRLGRTADVSISFEDAQGVRHYLRRDSRRAYSEDPLSLIHI